MITAGFRATIENSGDDTAKISTAKDGYSDKLKMIDVNKFDQ